MKRTALLLARVGIAFAAAISVLLLFGRSSSLIEIGTNFRPHFLVATLSLLAVGGALGGKRDLAAALVPVLILSMSTVPYWVGGPPPIPENAATARVMQFNLLYSNTDNAAILREILDADADIVALHELTTDHWDALELALRSEYPYSVATPVAQRGRESNGGGKAILSRTPLERVDLGPRYRSPPLVASIELHGQEVLAVALHPSPARTDEFLIEQRSEKMAAAVSAVAAHDGPAIVITDLNISPTSPEYSGFLNDLGWSDPRHDLGIEPTFPSHGWLAPFGVAIDHVLVSPELTVHSYELGDGGGSDHHSLVATISFPSEID